MADKQQSVDVRQSQQGCALCDGATTCMHLASTTFAGIPKNNIGEELSAVFPNYDVLGMIGEGGMSIVYKARHQMLNRLVAIKMLHSHLMRDEMQIRRFRQEAQALFVLEHPNIVSVRDFGTTEAGAPYLIMDYLEGKSLSEELRDSGPMPVGRALNVFIQACSALEHAHSKGIVHRDIKPSNLVLTKDKEGNDVVKVVDFGIAKLTQDGDINPGLTQTGDVFGSPLYMSPEQCLGQKLDARSDEYALGCVMYEVLSGDPPLVGESALATIHMHASDMPAPLTVPNCAPLLRDRLDELIYKTLEKSPDKRYESMRAVRRELEELLEADSLRRTTGLYVKFARLQRKFSKAVRVHPLRSLATLASAIALIAVSGYLATDRVLPLTVEPKTITETGQYHWSWNEPMKVSSPARFEDTFRSANFIIEQFDKAYGKYGEKTNLARWKLAGFLFSSGHFAEATPYYNEVYNYNRAKLGPHDVATAEAAKKLGDCYMLSHEPAPAVRCYEEVRQMYLQLPGIGRSERMDLNLNLANCLLRTTAGVESNALDSSDIEKIKKAYDLFSTATKFGQDAFSRMQEAMASSGMADCDRMLAELSSNPSKKQKYLAKAMEEYRAAYDRWCQSEGNSTVHRDYDKTLCLLRLGDTSLLMHKYDDAAAFYHEAENSDGYKEVVINPDGFRQNLARVLWRQGKWGDALREDQNYGHNR